ncbi:MAG: glutamate--tRNA ligase [Hyphomicrobiaceae bacterium]|nr:glutamate--tRNA ligase [Hyphomicrobiaceae bacterium]
MAVTVRFAPSPTGRLHIGNARTALYNALYALKTGGDFILRLDDTDTERSTQDFADGIVEDVAWLGIVPARTQTQTARKARHDAVADALRASGRLYACYETPEELEYRRRRLLARGLPPIYDRTGLSLTSDERTALEAEGRRPHWRFRLEGRVVEWDDLARGAQKADTASMSDPVLIREDGRYLYTLTSVVDDIDFAVTHIIRGEDHISNTGVQIELFEALGATAPAFGHHNLLTTADGEGLSKRSGALSLQSLRADGLEPMAVASLAVLTGTAHAVAARADLDALAGDFDLAAVSRGAARFDPADLPALNAQLLHAMTPEDAAPRLKALGLDPDPVLFEAVRANLVRLGDARLWWQVVKGEIAVPVMPEDAAFLRLAAERLPGRIDQASWGLWTKALKAETGRKGRALFHPLRLALTGEESGPELAALLPLIGPDKVRARLLAAAAA